VPFNVNNKNFTIKARRGDSGSIGFRFNMPLDGFDVDFCISKKLNPEKEDILVSKCYKNVSGTYLIVSLTGEDTEKLTTGENFSGQYFWTLKIHNENGFVMTLVPDKLTRTPGFIVFPKIGECPDEQ